MRYVIFALMCVLAVSFDCAFFPRLDLLGLTPDLTLFIVISVSLLQNTQIGLYVGVAGGILKGLYAAPPIGLSLIFYTGAVILAGLLKKRVSVDNVLVPSILVFLLFFVRDLLFAMYMFFINNPLSFSGVITLSTLPCAAFTAILSLALYWPVLKLNRKHFMTSIHDRELF